MKSLWQRLSEGGPGPTISAWFGLLRQRTLSRRILLPVLSAVAVVFLALGGLSYLMVRRQIVRSVGQAMDAQAALASRTVEEFFRHRVDDIQSLSTSLLIDTDERFRSQNRWGESELVRRALKLAVNATAQRAGVYASIGFYSPDGKPVAVSSKGGAPLVSPVAGDVLHQLKKGIRWDPPLEKGPAKYYAEPIFNEQGRFVGYIMAELDLTAVAGVLSDVHVKGGSAFLEDREGRQWLGVAPPSGKSLLRGQAVVHEGDDPDAWRYRVVVAAEEGAYLDRPLRGILGATAGICLGAVLFLMWLILTRVSNVMAPIHSMVQGTKRFAGGDLTFRLPAFKSRELDMLAASFNIMASTLETRNKELERRLRQATALRDMEESVIQRQGEETILRTCLESVSRGFGFDRTGLYWVDLAHKEIVGRYLFGSDNTGFSEMAFKKRRFPLGGNDVLNETITSRRTVITREHAMELHGQPSVPSKRPPEYCLAPICGKDRVLGVLVADNVDTHRSLTEADREGLMFFANAVGLAVENALLFTNLSESESKLRTVLENSPEAIVGLSREQWVNTWNRGAEKIFGYTASEALGKPLAILFPKTAGEDFKKLLNEVMDKGSVRDFSIPGQTKEGKCLDLSVSWGGQHADFWMNKEWTLVLRDVTEARQMQQQLIRSEKMSAVGQLISGIAHELNNPLQAVVGFSDMMEEDMIQRVAKPHQFPPLDPQDILRDARVLTENSLRCQKIIENLLTFVRQGDIEKRAVDLRSVIDSTLELLTYKVKKAAHIEVDIVIAPDTPPVKGNPQQIQQVCVNLVNNACDAMTMSDKPGPKVLRFIAHSEPNGMVRLEVSDTGPGIPAHVKDRIFDPFFTTKTEGRGTGLGLPVCMQIVQDHQGKMGFATESGLGTTFWVDFPASTEPLSSSNRRSVSLPPAVRGKSVLIVDDEPDVLGFLSKVIHAEGNRAEIAASVKEAVSKLSKETFDMVISDVLLGEGTGLTLYENWSLWTSHPRPAFLFMTGDVLTGTTTTDIEARGLRLLRKPIDLISLQRTLRLVLSGSHSPLNTPPRKS